MSCPSSAKRNCFPGVRFQLFKAISFIALLLTVSCLMPCLMAHADIGEAPYVETSSSAGSFPIVQGSEAAAIHVDEKDWPGVIRTAGDLAADIQRVTDRTVKIVHEDSSAGANAIIIGTVGKSPVIDRLASAGKIDIAGIKGKWESYFLQVVPNPLPGVANGLVIAGSDKRGTIFGIYDLSQQIGVSPWYWWADVPVVHKEALHVKAGKYQQGEPSVKYRGIFLNDESPDLTNWVRAKFGTVPTSINPNVPNNTANYGSKFYTKLFELILRIKGNYLWPAMWNNAFNEDDPENPRLADEYGIVMGTSHQEPMLRAQKEWDRGVGRENGNWNYNNVQQQPVLQEFWRQGVRRNKDYESIFTMGLRAENDSGAAIGAALTDQIVTVQRKILAEEINPDVTKVPQLWCLYKEVQGYYESGLRVPDDVTLLWAEDNWGNVRRLPTAEERKRAGGAGIYYHFDYHGGPRSYQWINTSPISKIWDQMSLAKDYGADRVWIVNAGHFKGYEFPIEYFISLGWNSNKWTNANINEYTRLWAAREFGPTHAQEIADIICKYTKYNGRRKPELLEASTYSVTNYNEAETVVADYKAIAEKAKEISAKLPAAARDAFYELVLFPTLACAQVNEMYVAAGKNTLYAQQGRASTNDMAAQTRALYQADADLMNYFNKTFADGKWDHFMDQSHIGYTSWQDPPQNNMNAIRLTEAAIPEAAAMGIAVDGSAAAWPPAPGLAGPAAGGGGRGRAGVGAGRGGAGLAPAPVASGDPVLPRFDAFNQQRRYIDVFNRGKTSFDFTAAASDPWIVLSFSSGKVDKDQRVWVSVDWAKAPKGLASGMVKISGAGNAGIDVKVEAFNPTEVSRDTLDGFVQGEGFVSIEAEHFTRNIAAGDVRWEKIDDYGRTLSAMTPMPHTAASVTPPQNSACLEYKIYLFDAGSVGVQAYVAPTLNFVPGRGLSFAMSFDDQAPRIIMIVPANFNAQNGNRPWEESVKDACRIVQTKLTLEKPGYHTLKIWMVDPAVVLEKIVVDLGGVKPCYLGPPESYFRVQTVAQGR
jgi:hypothetical protein